MLTYAPPPINSPQGDFKTSKIGIFTIRDLAYRYGMFNYYFYKRFSMITNENFTRGIKYGNGNDKVSTELTVEISDVADSLGNVPGDVQCMTKINFTEN
jgi:hypothetical protein